MYPPKDLALPEPGSTTLRTVLGEYLKQTLGDFLSFPPGRFDAAVADTFVRVRDWVRTLLRSGRAGVVLSILRQPTVSTLVRCVERELWAGGDVTKLDAWQSELSTLFALELAAAEELPEDGIRIRRRPDRLVSPSLGRAITIPPEYQLELGPGQLRLHAQGTTHTVDPSAMDDVNVPGVAVVSPYTPLFGSARLAVVDNNPLSGFEAHPEKSGNAIDLGGYDAEQWSASLRDAFDRVAIHLPDLAGEIELGMQCIVPVGYDAHQHVSASYAESIGTAYMSLHPDSLTMTEALIHEFSHNKINALLRLDPLVENGFGELHTSPVRPDPRPLHGVLLAVHAFVPVAQLYRKMLEEDEHPARRRRYEQIVQSNHEGIRVLVDNARCTEIGRAVLDELAAWDATFESARQLRA